MSVKFRAAEEVVLQRRRHLLHRPAAAGRAGPVPGHRAQRACPESRRKGGHRRHQPAQHLLCALSQRGIRRHLYCQGAAQRLALRRPRGRGQGQRGVCRGPRPLWERAVQADGGIYQQQRHDRHGKLRKVLRGGGHRQPHRLADPGGLLRQYRRHERQPPLCPLRRCRRQVAPAVLRSGRGLPQL